MGRLQNESGDREEVVASVMLDVLPVVTGKTLVVDDRGHLAQKAQGHTVLWSRYARPGTHAQALPDDDRWSQVVIRLPKGRLTFEMAVHLACHGLEEGGICYVYGANDEGVRSVGKKLSQWFERVWTVQTKRKCRVVAASGPKVVLKGTIEAWRMHQTIALSQDDSSTTIDPWWSWPGLFAAGALDDATALLVDALPQQAPGRVLDYGSGTGILARVVSDRGATQVHAIDADAIAVLATQSNVPAATVLLGDSLDVLPHALRFDWIVSNPPFHQGKDEDFGVMRALIDGAKQRTDVLWLVTQRQVPCGPLMQAVFEHVDVVAKTTRFSVWRAH